ncbi:helix-turn-helix domain-containing protein [Bacillus sp. NPDC077027]|uniref:helix-turn-helix domain-containing protein n=1 Tax=Bacillus sp. NPDC077027 TaxID=3390548 RepID=UPI003D07BE08
MELIDNKSKRWIQILKLLVSRNKWWTFQEIADEKIGSVRAIQSDLEQMKTFKTEDGEPLIRMKPRQGVSICFKQNLRVDYYIKEILKDNIEIRLIHGIFFEHKMSFHKWMETLNISRSTLYNTINKINTALEEYDIELRPDSMQFYGNEKEIRHFFVEFFFEIYGNRLWPFDQINKQDTADLLQDLFQILGVNVPDVAIDKYCLWFAVFVHRIRQNFTIKRKFTYSMLEEKQTSEAKVVSNKISAWEEHIREKAKQKFNITLDHHEFVFLFLIEPSIGHFKSIESIQEKLAFFRLHTPRLYEAIQSFIDQLELIYHKEISNRKLLSLLLLQYHVYTNEITGRDGFLFKKKARFVEEVKKQLPYFYSRITNMIQQLKTDDILAPFVRNQQELICMITSNWRGLVQLEMERKTHVNIFVTSTLGYNHSLFIADLIKTSAVHPIQIFTSPENFLNESYMAQSQIDLIVTDTDLSDRCDRPTLMISSFPTKKELDNLHRTLSEMTNS